MTCFKDGRVSTFWGRWFWALDYCNTLSIRTINPKCSFYRCLLFLNFPIAGSIPYPLDSWPEACAQWSNGYDLCQGDRNIAAVVLRKRRATSNCVTFIVVAFISRIISAITVRRIVHMNSPVCIPIFVQYRGTIKLCQQQANCTLTHSGVKDEAKHLRLLPNIRK